MSLPQSWIYYLALIIPLIVINILMHTPFVDWLWYQGYADQYYFLAALKVDPTFIEFVGGWPFSVFLVTVICFWFTSGEAESVPTQFLLLPLAYVPFSIAGTALANFAFNPATLYTHPLVIIPLGYIYVIPWVILAKILTRMRIFE